MLSRVSVLLCLLATGSSVRADGLEVPRDHFEFDADLNGRGEKMNYGPFLTYSLTSAHCEPAKSKKDKPRIDPLLRAEKTPPIVLRSINVYLGGRYTASFDTEMCGFTAAWSGGFLDISRSNLNGYKGDDLAYLRRPVIFQNALTPGWSLNGDFRDTRPIPFGALPKNVAHYRGLYLHGWRTILSYTVGESRVLELPAMLVKDRASVFSRTIHIDRATSSHSLFVCDLPEALSAVPTALKRKDTILRVAVSHLPEGARLLNDGKDRIVLKLPAHDKPITFKVFIARDIEPAILADIVKQVGEPENLLALCKGGPSRWKETVTVAGRLGKDDGPYTVDTIPLPDSNPWNSWMRPGALDFLSDGRAVLCTMNGDVWIASGLSGKLEKIVWKRFATGLFEPLGLKVVNDQIYVLGRDQITRLHDLNGDGEADFYENFNNDGPTAPSFHSFAMELHTDPDGNFYYSRGAHRVKPGTPMHGGIIKVAKDGSKAELLCLGLREANGIGVSPDGLITAADNQGNWVPTSKIDIIRPGRWYGFVWDEKPPYPKVEPPLCWIPYKEDNSSGGQVWVTSDRWGPFKGHMLHTAYGSSKLFKVYVQRDGECYQGGVAAFPLTFDSGIMRGRFHPRDGQLYVCGLKGWGTNAKQDGCLQRVRYTGKPVTMPTDLRVSKDRIEVRFATALDRASVSSFKPEVEQWNYRWSEAYGSKDYSVADPKKVGHDKVRVKCVRLSDDGKSLVLEVLDLKPVMQMGIGLKGLKLADGTPVEVALYNTINYLP